jgi:hypothetical protein
MMYYIKEMTAETKDLKKRLATESKESKERETDLIKRLAAMEERNSSRSSSRSRSSRGRYRDRDRHPEESAKEDKGKGVMTE